MPLIDLIRDEEFESLLPHPSAAALKELEHQMIDEEGPREPILVWKGTKIIVDGYRRHKLCLKHKLPFPVEELEFADRTAVKRWMLKNQLARRNLAPQQESMALASLAELLSQQGGKKREAGKNIAKQVAQEAGVDERTVYRAKKYAEAVKSLASDVREAVEQLGAAQGDIVELAAIPVDQQRDLIESVTRGEFTSIHAAIQGEESVDDVQEPVKPIPSRSKKPAEDVFAEVYRSLGVLKKSLDALSLACPGPYYDRAIGFLDKASDVVSAWKKAEQL